MDVSSQLEAAWKKRPQGTGALRLFHGPGEGRGALASIAVDRFGEHVWVTQWGSGSTEGLAEFYGARGLRSGVLLKRPEKGVPEEPSVLFGNPPTEEFSCEENGANFWIRLRGALHPGLFLDHAPLRAWLNKNAGGLEVLNTFAYTGSLSVAAGLGGAKSVATLDLSRPTVEWARRNWALNGLGEDKADFIYGDYFEWMPKFARKQRSFDLVILDPPSFSRGNRGSFSTSKDLVKLHAAALPLLKSGAYLVTSINSANVTKEKFRAEILEAAEVQSVKFEEIDTIMPPQTFPAGSEHGPELKGWILRKV